MRFCLGEAGKVNYADSPQRRYSVGTLAHSTAIVDGLGQNSRRAHQNGHSKSLNALDDIDCALEGPCPWIKGMYVHGYGVKGEVAVRHKRTVILHSATRITITDRFSADDVKPHVIEILFHLLKDNYEMQDSGACTIGERPNISLTSRATGGEVLSVSAVFGGSEPDLRGWAAMDSADYKGSKDLVPRPCITVTARMEQNIEVVTELSICD